MRFAAFILLVVGLVSCASSGVTDPKTQKQLQTVQLLQRLEEFQDTVVDLYQSSQISPEHALVYTKFTVSATKTVKTLPDGWQSTVKASWTQLRSQVPFDKMEVRVQMIAKLLDALIAAL